MLRKSLLFSTAIAGVLLGMSTVERAHAQGRGMGMFGGGVNPLGIVSNKAVQKELKVSDEKADKIKDIADDVRQEMTEQVTGAGIDFRGLRDLSGEERAKRFGEIQAKMAEIRKNLDDKFMPKLAEILDKGQMTRLHEIAVQAAGPSALRDAGVAKDLGLSKEQQDKLASINKDFDAKRMQIPRDGDAADRNAKMSELTEEQNAKSNEVLTKQQQEQFTKLKGAPFDVKQLRQGQRRRRNNN